MAKNTDVLIRIKGVNETSEATNEAIKNIEALETAGRKATRETKKDWGGVTDLFSNLLPRGLQRSVRQFKSTQRQVGRLSKSFTVLKGAMMGLVTGGLIVGLEMVMDNWEAIAKWVSRVSDETIRVNELQAKQAESANKTEGVMKRHLQVLEDITSTDAQRVYALQEMAKEMGELRELDLTSLDAQEQITQAYKDHLKLKALRISQNDDELRLTELLNAEEEKIFRLSKEEWDMVNLKSRVRGEEAAKKYKADLLAEKSADAQKKAADEIAAITSRQREADDEILEIENRITGTLDLQKSKREDITESTKSQLEAEREAAKTQADIARQAEADADYLADLEKRVSEEIMLAKIEDEQKRAEKELELRHIEMEAKATAAGATSEQLLLIDEKYEQDKAALKESYREDDPSVKTPEEIAEEQAAVLAEMDLAALNELEMERFRIQERLDQRLELANGNRELELEAERLFLDEMDALAEDSEMERVDIKKAGIKATVNAARGLFSTMGKMAEEGSEQAKALAITDVLLAQAVSLANGISAAAKAAKDPWSLAAGILTAIASVMGAFVGVKAILNEAGTSAGGGGGIPSTTPLSPDQVSRTETTGKAFVVQSDLEGAALQANQLRSQTSLGGG